MLYCSTPLYNAVTKYGVLAIAIKKILNMLCVEKYARLPDASRNAFQEGMAQLGRVARRARPHVMLFLFVAKATPPPPLRRRVRVYGRLREPHV